MSKEGDDGRRLNQCLRKYQIMLKQFDELVDIMDARSRPPPKRRKGAKGNGSSSASASTRTRDDHGNEALVQTISRFLHELRFTPATTDSGCSSSNPHQGPNMPS